MKARFPALLGGPALLVGPALLALALVASLGLFLIALQQSSAAAPTNPDPGRAGCRSPAAR